MDADVKPDLDLGMGIPKLDPSEFKTAMEERGSSPKQLHIVDDSGYRSFDNTESRDSIFKSTQLSGQDEDEDLSKEEPEEGGEPLG